MRLAHYPFNKYSKVYVVKFDSPSTEFEIIDPRYSNVQTLKKKIFIPTKMQKMDTTLFLTYICLSRSQIDSLTIILYNYS